MGQSRLPVITGFGGYNAAGRSSGHIAYRRMVLDSLANDQQNHTLMSLAALMGIVSWKDGGYVDVGGHPVPSDDVPADIRRQVLDGTLVRRIENTLFDPQAVSTGQPLCIPTSSDSPVQLTLAVKHVPMPLPKGWKIISRGDRECRIEISETLITTYAGTQVMPVQAAGQLPSGFNPGDHYRSLHHPRGLQLSVMAASDAVHSMGIDWETVISSVRPDEIAVYSSSVMSQLDSSGLGGMLQARRAGGRVTSKQLALGLNSMPADFVNAYVLGNVGSTAGVTGACATFLYNLRMAADEIKQGRCRVAVVGSAEAPIIPEVIDGYSAMSALATDADLRNLDRSEHVDYRRASRPFGENCGFTLAESGQYVVLMDDALAIELGADIFGSVPGVYVNADGYKKSISAPGPGNYITMAKAVALANTLLGEDAVRNRSFVQAHGSSTPQNRVTESKIFDKIAESFGINSWPVSAVKSYLGHSLGPASGDQLMASLGVFAHGILPGIKTIDSVADDVCQERLSISNKDVNLGVERASVAFLNSKGFGGNNATATIFSASVTESLLAKRYGEASLSTYKEKRETTRERADVYQTEINRGSMQAVYHFGQNMIEEDDIQFSDQKMAIPGFEREIDLMDDAGFTDIKQSS